MATSHLEDSTTSFHGSRRKFVETTQLFKDFVSSVKTQTERNLASPESRADVRPIRYQKARKSTNPVQSSAYPFLLCFSPKAQSSPRSESLLELTFDKPKSRGGSKERETTSNALPVKEETNDEILENNAIRIVTETEIKGSADAVLELDFSEPRRDRDGESEPSEEMVRVKRELAELSSSIKIVTENDPDSDAILELTFDEPRKGSTSVTTDGVEEVRIKKEKANDEIEPSSLQIFKDSGAQGSTDAILELTFDEPERNSNN